MNDKGFGGLRTLQSFVNPVTGEVVWKNQQQIDTEKRWAESARKQVQAYDDEKSRQYSSGSQEVQSLASYKQDGTGDEMSQLREDLARYDSLVPSTVYETSEGRIAIPTEKSAQFLKDYRAKGEKPTVVNGYEASGFFDNEGARYDTARRFYGREDDENLNKIRSFMHEKKADGYLSPNMMNYLGFANQESFIKEEESNTARQKEIEKRLQQMGQMDTAEMYNNQVGFGGMSLEDKNKGAGKLKQAHNWFNDNLNFVGSWLDEQGQAVELELGSEAGYKELKRREAAGEPLLTGWEKTALGYWGADEDDTFMQSADNLHQLIRERLTNRERAKHEESTRGTTFWADAARATSDSARLMGEMAVINTFAGGVGHYAKLAKLGKLGVGIQGAIGATAMGLLHGDARMRKLMADQVRFDAETGDLKVTSKGAGALEAALKGYGSGALEYVAEQASNAVFWKPAGKLAKGALNVASHIPGMSGLRLLPSKMLKFSTDVAEKFGKSTVGKILERVASNPTMDVLHRLSKRTGVDLSLSGFINEAISEELPANALSGLFNLEGVNEDGEVFHLADFWGGIVDTLKNAPAMAVSVAAMGAGTGIATRSAQGVYNYATNRKTVEEALKQFGYKDEDLKNKSKQELNDALYGEMRRRGELVDEGEIDALSDADLTKRMKQYGLLPDNDTGEGIPIEQKREAYKNFVKMNGGNIVVTKAANAIVKAAARQIMGGMNHANIVERLDADIFAKHSGEFNAAERDQMRQVMALRSMGSSYKYRGNMMGYLMNDFANGIYEQLSDDAKAALAEFESQYTAGSTPVPGTVDAKNFVYEKSTFKHPVTQSDWDNNPKGGYVDFGTGIALRPNVDEDGNADGWRVDVDGTTVSVQGSRMALDEELIRYGLNPRMGLPYGVKTTSFKTLAEARQFADNLSAWQNTEKKRLLNKAKAAQMYYQRIRGEDVGGLVLLRSLHDAPENIKDEIVDALIDTSPLNVYERFNNKVKGFVSTQDGKVYVALDKVTSPYDLLHTIQHEGVHQGLLDTFMGDKAKVKAFFAELAKEPNLPLWMKEEIAKNGNDPRGLEELLATVAENVDAGPTLFNSVSKAMRNATARVDGMELSEGDVHSIIFDAYKAARMDILDSNYTPSGNYGRVKNDYEAQQVATEESSATEPTAPAEDVAPTAPTETVATTMEVVAQTPNSTTPKTEEAAPTAPKGKKKEGRAAFINDPKDIFEDEEGENGEEAPTPAPVEGEVKTEGGRYVINTEDFEEGERIEVKPTETAPAPTEEVKVEEVKPTEETPVEAAPTEETPAEENPTKEKSTEETPVEAKPTETAEPNEPQAEATPTEESKEESAKVEPVKDEAKPAETKPTRTVYDVAQAVLDYAVKNTSEENPMILWNDPTMLWRQDKGYKKIGQYAIRLWVENREDGPALLYTAHKASYPKTEEKKSSKERPSYEASVLGKALKFDSDIQQKLAREVKAEGGEISADKRKGESAPSSVRGRIPLNERAFYRVASTFKRPAPEVFRAYQEFANTQNAGNLREGGPRNYTIGNPNTLINDADVKTYATAHGLKPEAVSEMKKLAANARKFSNETRELWEKALRGGDQESFEFAFETPEAQIGKYPTISSVIAEQYKRPTKFSSRVRGQQINSAEDIAAMMMALRSPYQEMLKAVYLDANNRVLDAQILTFGAATQTLITPNLLFNTMPNGTASMIISHNHPSGNVEPSSADIAMTESLKVSAGRMGVALVDHVVTNGTKYYSLLHDKQYDLPKKLQKKMSWELISPENRVPVNLPTSVYNYAVNIVRQDGDKAALLYLDHKRRIVAVRLLPKEILDDGRISEEERNRAFFGGAATNGALAMIMYTPAEVETKDMYVIRHLAAASAEARVPLLDVIYGGKSSAELAGAKFYSARTLDSQLFNNIPIDKIFWQTAHDSTVWNEGVGNLRESEPNGVQKSANVNYPNAAKEINMSFAGNLREGMGNKRKAEAEALIGRKRPDLKDDAKRLVEEIAKFKQPKEQKAALHWVIAGSIRLPEDAYKVTEAIGYGERAKGKGETDAMKYKSPMEMIDALHEFKPKAKPIDPDTVPELSDKKDLGHGITTYLVQDDKEGQLAMRKIINTHWGEDANPWCLLCGDGKGNLADGSNGTYNAWYYWQYYDALPKRVAFKDGKLHAFMATEGQEFSEEDPLDFIDNYTDEVYEEDISEEVYSLVRSERPELWDEFVEIAEDEGYDADESGFHEWVFDVHEDVYNEFEDKIRDEKLADVRSQLESEHEDWLKRKQEAAEAEEWWDREDSAHDGVPIEIPLEKDPRKRHINAHVAKDGGVTIPAKLYDSHFMDSYDYWDSNGNITHKWHPSGKLKMLREYNKDGSYVESSFTNSGHIIDRLTYNKGRVKNGPYELYYPGADDVADVHTGKFRPGYESRIKKKGTLKNGKPDGSFEMWHFNGKLHQRGTIKNGKFVGEGKAWYDDGSLQGVLRFDDEGKEVYKKLYSKGEYFEEGALGDNFGNLREGEDTYDGVLYVKHVYHNGKLVELASLKHGDKFSHEADGEEFVFVDNFGAIGSAVTEITAQTSRAKHGYQREGLVRVNNVVYKYKETNFGLRVKEILPKTLKSSILFNEWKDEYAKTNKTSTVDATLNANGGRGRDDGRMRNDAIAIGKTAKDNGSMDRTILGEVWRVSNQQSLSKHNNNNSKTPSNATGTNVNNNLSGNTREGDLEAHLQARRDAMPKMGLEAARANVQAALHREPGETRKAWSKRKVKATADFIAEKMYDARSPIIDAMREITGQKSYDESVDIPLAMQTSYGRVFAKHQDIDRDFVNPTLQILADNGLDVETLDTYLVARHAPERNKMIEERTKYGRFKGNLAGSGITNEVAAQRIEELRKRLSASQFNALERAANRVWAMNRDNLDRLVEFGIMSEAQAETWKKLSPHYVPLRDDLEALGIEMPYGTSMAGQNYIKAVGRFSESTTSQFAWSILQAKQGAMWAEQNYINNIALNFCMQNQSPEDYRVSKLPIFVKKALSENKGFREEDAHPLRASVPEELDAINAYRTQGFTVVQDKDDSDIFWVDAREFDRVIRVKKDADALRTAMRHNVVAKVGGRRVYILFNPKKGSRGYKMGSAISRANMVSPDNFIWNTYEKLMRVKAAFTTTMSITFAFSNAIKDVINTSGLMLTEGHNKALADMYKNYTPMLKEVYLWKRNGEFSDTELGRYAKEAVDNGILTGTWANATHNDVMLNNILEPLVDMQKRKKFGKELGATLDVAYRSAKNFLNTASEIPEVGIRLAVYAAMRKNGTSMNDATVYAREITVDFNKKGTLSPITNVLYMFSNAAVQGFARWHKALYKDGEFNTKGAFLAATTFFLIGFFNKMLIEAIYGGDDDDRDSEEWKNIPDFAYQRGIPIMLGDHYVNVPMQGGLPNVFTYLGSRIYDVVANNNTTVAEAFIDTAKGPLMDSGNFVNGSGSLLQYLMPTFADPIVQIAENKTYAGIPLHAQDYGNDATPHSYLGRKNTSKWAINVAKALNRISGGNDIEAGALDVYPETVALIGQFFTSQLGTDIAGVGSLLTGDFKTKNVPVLRTFLKEIPDNTQRYFKAMKDFEQAHQYLKSYQSADRTDDIIRLYERKPYMQRAYALDNIVKRIRKVNTAKNKAAARGLDTAELEESLQRLRTLFLEVYYNDGNKLK